MLVEHTFVTTQEGPAAMSGIVQYLQAVGFRLTASAASALEAVRGRRRPNTSRIAQLPQAVKVQFDRGRVNVAASITPRGGKEKPAHADYLSALASGMDLYLSGRLPLEQAVANLRLCEVKVGSVAGAADKVIYTVLIVLGILIAVGLIIALASAAFS